MTILWIIVIIFIIIWAVIFTQRLNRQTICNNEGGVYFFREDVCMEKDSTINIKNNF